MHSVRDNIAITIWRRLAGALGLIGRARDARGEPFVERLEVSTPSLDQTVGNLSGGNQQKVSIAKWLAANAEILIIDEPTVGIDIKTKTYLHELIGEIAARRRLGPAHLQRHARDDHRSPTASWSCTASASSARSTTTTATRRPARRSWATSTRSRRRRSELAPDARSRARQPEPRPL